jgi:acyl-coenzyme A synthetase/AMP-(fatty) acid ligase
VIRVPRVPEAAISRSAVARSGALQAPAGFGLSVYGQ